MRKVIFNIVVVVYAVIAIFVTICLLSYNDYKISEFGDYSLIIIDNNNLESDYKKGDLVITDKSADITVGDKIFFYNTYERDLAVSVAQIVDEEKITEKEITYTLEGDRSISSQYVIGTCKDASKFENFGTILGILESKWGFLFLVVLPTLIAFLYEIFEVISELKNNSGKNDENDKKGSKE